MQYVALLIRDSCINFLLSGSEFLTLCHSHRSCFSPLHSVNLNHQPHHHHQLPFLHSRWRHCLSCPAGSLGQWCDWLNEGQGGYTDRVGVPYCCCTIMMECLVNLMQSDPWPGRQRRKGRDEGRREGEMFGGGGGSRWIATGFIHRFFKASRFYLCSNKS